MTPRHQQDHRILAVEVENHVAAVAVVVVVVVAMAMVHPDISGEMSRLFCLHDCLFAGCKLYIGNLSFSTQGHDLREHFSQVDRLYDRFS